MNRIPLATVNTATGSKLPISKAKPVLKEDPKAQSVKRKTDEAPEAPDARRKALAPAKPAAATAVKTRATSAALGKTAPISLGKTAPVASAAAAKKRPTWDYKGRLEDMEKLASFLQEKNQTETVASSQLSEMMKETCERIIRLETQRAAAWQSGDVESGEAIAMLKTLEEDLANNKRKHELEMEELQFKHSRQVRELNEIVSNLTDDRDENKRKLTAARDQIESLSCSISKMAADALAFDSQLRSTKALLEMSQSQSEMKSSEIASLKAHIQHQQQLLQTAEEKSQADEIVRRKLHNTIQELKGNIRVFCRVRPLLPSDGADYQGQPTNNVIGFTDSQSLQLRSEESNYTGKSAAKAYDFAFDKVFTPTSTQAEVFEEISQLVQSALDGYNICIFAYGQTGSGKTHTMGTTDCIQSEQRGMIPRAMEQIFLSVEALKSKGWQYEMKASFLEIYNETIRDLLGNADDQKKHEIKKGAQEVYVTDIEEPVVTNESQVYSLLSKAAGNRSVAKTHMNEQSSRSHSVFRLSIVGKNTATDDTCRATLNLVDLAGSERLAKSGSAGDRLKETQSINESLSNLGNVIMALGSKASHIPYRNSKLTYLLQDSLGGNSKSLMFVNINPREDSIQETLCSLRFATKVNQCNIGTAQKTKPADK